MAPDAVILALDGATGGEAVQALHGRLAVLTNAVMDAPRFLSDVRPRMRLASVCIADDVALSHARTTAVNLRVVAALSRRLREPGARSGLFAAGHEEEFRALLAGGVAARQ